MTEREIATSIRVHTPHSELMLHRIEDPAYAALFTLLRSKFLGMLSVGTSLGSGEDLLQELYTIMLAALEDDRIDDLDALSAFARGAARHLRSAAIEKQTERLRRAVDIRPAFKSYEREIIEREEAAELAGVLTAMIAGLEPLDRELVDRFYFRGHTGAMIAAALGITEGRFRGKMSRLRVRLKRDYERTQRLAPEDDNSPVKEPA